MCISNELYCFEVKQNNPVELHTQALSAQRIHYQDRQVLLHNNKLPFTLDIGTTVPIAITVMSTHIFVICKFVIMSV